MTVPATPDESARFLLLVLTPAAWPTWPFLPVTRRTRGRAEYGVLFDARGAVGLTGYSAAVFFCNLFALPPTLPGFLAVTKEVFDTAEELVAAGWAVD